MSDHHHPDDDDDDECRRSVPGPPMSGPEFRFVQMQTEDDDGPIRFAHFAGPKSPPSASLDEINIDDYKSSKIEKQDPTLKLEPSGSLWYPRQLRQPPAFYPLEKSTRLVEDTDPQKVASRLSECLRTLSVYAIYDNDAATASLFTGENVEMQLSLWRTPNNATQSGVLVEVQRRKGDSIAFYRYCRSILDAAGMDGDLAGIAPLEDAVYSKKVQRLLAMELRNKKFQEHENAILAIEIAHGLLIKDRMDASQLGLESLCLLTDPNKTGYITAMLTAHVVLLGSTHGVQIPGVSAEEQDGPTTDILMNEGPFQEIRETILNLVLGEILEEEEGEGMEITIDKEHKMLLHNLALAVLANALDVIENKERYEDEPEDTKPSAKVQATPSADVAETFMTESMECSNSNQEVLATLISELGKARHKPHNATLSAKCIGSLCRASEEARRRAQELGAKVMVARALDVGVRTHLKLETECKKVQAALETPRTDDA